MPRKFYMRMNYPIAKRIQDSLYSLLCTLTRESSPVNICLLMHNAPAAHPCRLQQPRYTHVDPTIRMTHTGSIQWRLVNYQNILRSRPLYQNWSYIVIYWRHHIPGGRYRRAWELGRTSCVSGFLGPLGMSSSYLFVNTDEANFSWKLRFPYPCQFHVHNMFELKNEPFWTGSQKELVRLLGWLRQMYKRVRDRPNIHSLKLLLCELKIVGLNRREPQASWGCNTFSKKRQAFLEFNNIFPRPQ